MHILYETSSLTSQNTYTETHYALYAFVGSVLGQRRRRWSKTEPTKAQCLSFTEEKIAISTNHMLKM